MLEPLNNQKSLVFKELNTLKVLKEDADKRYQQALNIYNVANQINQDPVSFVIDLVKELVGYDKLRDIISNFLAQNLGDVEDTVKELLKRRLKELTSCGTNPVIPPELKSTGSGYSFDLDKIDFARIFKLAPTSEYGPLVYADPSGGLNSTDCNTFMYNMIQEDGTEKFWGSQTGTNDIVGMTFNTSLAGLPTLPAVSTNVLTIKASNYYSTNKGLTDWNNDYIDSIDFFPDAQFFSKLMDSVFNTLTEAIPKPRLFAEVEEKVNAIVDKMVNSEPGEVLDDSYFEFTNPELKTIKQKARLKSLGFASGRSCRPHRMISSANDAKETVENFNTAVTLMEKTTVINDSLNIFAEKAGEDSPADEKDKIKMNFFVDLLEALTKSLVNLIIGPKIYVLFCVNFKIIQGSNVELPDVDEFLKQNQALIQEVVDIIKGMVVAALLEVALVEIKKLQQDVVEKIKQELINNRLKSILSLGGVPQNIIRKISSKF